MTIIKLINWNEEDLKAKWKKNNNKKYIKMNEWRRIKNGKIKQRVVETIFFYYSCSCLVSLFVFFFSSSYKWQLLK